MRLRARLLAAIAVTLSLVPASAAEARFERGVTAPAFRDDGRSILPELRRTGARFLVVSTAWSAVAPQRPVSPGDPADPAYRWEGLDATAAEGRRHGIELVPMVSSTPGWANGGQPGNVGPDDPLDYARFLMAMSRRYPQFRRWMIWGEPSRAQQWSPQGVAGARRYAVLLDRAYGGLKRIRPTNVVIGGNSFVGGADDGVSTSTPTWISRLRLPGGRRPRMDVYGMNPFTWRPIDLSQPQVNRNLVDFNDMDQLVQLLDRAFPGRRLPLFLSETGFPTGPGIADYPFRFSEREQALRIRQSYRAAAGLGRIDAMANYLLYDQPPVIRDGAPRQWTTGLLTASGRRKPGWHAFRAAPGGR